MKKNEINFLNKKLYIYGVSKILDNSINYTNIIIFKNNKLKFIIFKTNSSNEIIEYRSIVLYFYKKDIKKIYEVLKKYGSIELNCIDLYIESYCKKDYDVNSDYFKQLQKRKEVELNLIKFKVKSYELYSDASLF